MLTGHRTALVPELLGPYGSRERLRNCGPDRWFFTLHSRHHHWDALKNMVQRAEVGPMDWDLKQLLRQMACAVENENFRTTGGQILVRK